MGDLSFREEFWSLYPWRDTYGCSRLSESLASGISFSSDIPRGDAIWTRLAVVRRLLQRLQYRWFRYPGRTSIS